MQVDLYNGHKMVGWGIYWWNECNGSYTTLWLDVSLCRWHWKHQSAVIWPLSHCKYGEKVSSWITRPCHSRRLLFQLYWGSKYVVTSVSALLDSSVLHLIHLCNAKKWLYSCCLHCLACGLKCYSCSKYTLLSAYLAVSVGENYDRSVNMSQKKPVAGWYFYLSPCWLFVLAASGRKCKAVAWCLSVCVSGLLWY